MKIKHRKPNLLTLVIINAYFEQRICSIYSSILRRPTVHANPSRKRSFSKTSLQTQGSLRLRFSVVGQLFEKGAFRNRRLHSNHILPPPEFSSNTNPN